MQYFERNGSSAKIRAAVVEMMFAGVEAEVEPFGVVAVGFEVLSTRVYVEIDVLQNIAHD